MNATRLTTAPVAQDLPRSRPALSGTHEGGGLLSGLLRALLPFRGASAKASGQRAEPRLQSARAEENGAANERREPYLFTQRRASTGTAD